MLTGETKCSNVKFHSGGINNLMTRQCLRVGSVLKSICGNCLIIKPVNSIISIFFQKDSRNNCVTFLTLDKQHAAHSQASKILPQPTLRLAVALMMHPRWDAKRLNKLLVLLCEAGVLLFFVAMFQPGSLSNFALSRKLRKMTNLFRTQI